MPQYTLDLRNKGCPEGHPTIQLTGMNQELFEVECSTCGWKGYDVDLITISKKEDYDEPRK